MIDNANNLVDQVLKILMRDNQISPKHYSDLEEIAANRHPEANRLLGYLYEHGINVETNLERSLSYYKLGAEAQSGAAAYNVGVIYLDTAQYSNLTGLGSPKERHAQGIEWMNRAVSLGDTFALVYLGDLYKSGRGVVQDTSQSLDFYQRASDLENPEGLARLACCYRDGFGVNADVDREVDLLQASCSRGNSWACSQLGRYHSEEAGPCDLDEHEAMRYFESAADLGSTPELAWFGEAHAMGVHGFKRDFGKGLPFLDRAAKNGVARAKYVLAVLMARGDIVESDSHTAFNLCKEAAVAKEVDAQYMLGRMFERGDGVKRSTSEAIYWIKQAAENGHQQAGKKLNELSK